MLMVGWGIQRQQYGEQKYWMLVMLVVMLGQIGILGGGFGFFYYYFNGGNLICVGGVLLEMFVVIVGQVSEVVDDGGMMVIFVVCIVDVLENFGGKYQYNGKE